MSAAVEHLHRQHEVFPLVRVRNVKCLGGAILFAVVQIELLHVLVGVADTNKGAKLRGLFGLAVPEHLLLAHPPAVAEQVDAGRRTEESLLVAVRFLSDFRVEDHDDHVAAVAQVPLHGLPGESLVLVVRSVNTTETRVC